MGHKASLVCAGLTVLHCLALGTCWAPSAPTWTAHLQASPVTGMGSAGACLCSASPLGGSELTSLPGLPEDSRHHGVSHKGETQGIWAESSSGRHPLRAAPPFPFTPGTGRISSEMRPRWGEEGRRGGGRAGRWRPPSTHLLGGGGDACNAMTKKPQGQCPLGHPDPAPGTSSCSLPQLSLKTA